MPQSPSSEQEQEQEQKQKRFEVKIHPDTDAAIRGLLNEQVEYGGIMEPRFDSKTLNLTHWNRGKHYDAVSIPAGVVQWHTHPRACTPTRCTLGIPSGPDLAGFAGAMARGDSLMHLVYSADGIYAIVVDDSYLDAMKADKEFFKHFQTLANTNFNAITGDYINSDNHTDSDYKAFRNKWIAMANSSGFRVRLYENGVTPVFFVDRDVFS